ncbi:MAG: flagellar filament capping protein FliD [Desulfobacteraceae bacterium]|nr:flagellar filament capping protein FliD [Desulfobacteraceae bacterium]
MASSTSSTSSTGSSGLALSGIGSGYDWQSVIEKLQKVEEATVTPYQDQITAYEDKLEAWASVKSSLSTLQSAADDLSDSKSLELYTTNLSSSSDTDASTILSATASDDGEASEGSYSVVVDQRAQAEKLASISVTSSSSALNLSGTVLVNGHAMDVETSDTLSTLKTKINALNSGDYPTGVTASIIKDSDSTYRLVLTSGETGESGIALQNGSSNDILASLGFNGSGTVVKNSVAGAAQSDALLSSTTAVETLLGNDGQNLSGTVTINGVSVNIDLSDSLETIKSNLVAAGLGATISSEMDDEGDYWYTLEIEGMSTWTDQNNVLQSLGLIEGSRADEIGVSSKLGNTTDGSTAITASTNIVDIYGYTDPQSGDKLTISGTKHDGTAVAATDLTITSTTTVQDLLTQVESLFGNVTASITAEGKIQVVDKQTGTSSLSVTIGSTLNSTSGGLLDFGTFSTAGAVRKTVLQAGQDAIFSVDGMSMTSSSNTVTTAIQGVTLKLLGAEAGTTVTVNIQRDTDGIEEKVNTMLDAYNSLMSYINQQMEYNEDSKTTGGVLFGDTTLTSVKSQIQSILQSCVGDRTIQYLAEIGITQDENNQLVMDTDEFEDAIASNFEDIVALFSDTAKSSDDNFSYSYSTRDTLSGTYSVTINQLTSGSNYISGTIDGYDATGYSNLITLKNSESGANGLQVCYTGSTVPATATITVTRGLASLLETALYNMTDSISGSVSTMEEGMQTSISKLYNKVSDMETRIAAKMAALTKQFQNMDTAVAQMQSMQSYISSML